MKAAILVLADVESHGDLGRGPAGRGPQIAPTHEQIAALVGTSRETATKVLGEFAGRGVIRLGRGRITVLDRDAIRREAGND